MLILLKGERGESERESREAHELIGLILALLASLRLKRHRQRRDFIGVESRKIGLKRDESSTLSGNIVNYSCS
jgi:hypothetical protein